MSTHKSDFDKDMGFTVDDPLRNALHISPAGTPESPSVGYETSDVGIRGIVVFLSVLAASLAVFFVVCFALGKLINHELIKQDGPPTVWNQLYYGPESAKKREDMASNPVLRQQQLSTLTRRFPNPRLQTDDGNQDTADLHAKEDLLLEHYTYVDKGAGTVRIPIERAMQLVVERGLGSQGNAAPAGGVSQLSPSPAKLLAGERRVVVTPPLTDGFARTGPEQEIDEERLQKLESREAMAEHQQAQSNGK